MPVGPSLRVVCKVRTQQAENFDEEALGLQDVYYPWDHHYITVSIIDLSKKSFPEDFFSSKCSCYTVRNESILVTPLLSVELA